MTLRPIAQPRRLISLLLAVAILALLSAPASADHVFHSDQVPFTPVGDAPLRSGFVVGIHANGPQIYAHEQFAFNGAVPNATLLVTLFIHTGDLECQSTAPIALPVALVETNPAGNGGAKVAFGPEAPEAFGLRGTTASARWEASLDGAVLYETGCIVVTFD